MMISKRTRTVEYSYRKTTALRDHALAVSSSNTNRPGAYGKNRSVKPDAGPVKSSISIPFQGLLTNKLLVALPSEEFDRILQYLEPVSFIANQQVYEVGQSIEYIYFPETAVVSHIYLLEDGNKTGAAIIGNEGLLGLSSILDSRPALNFTQVVIAGNALRLNVQILKGEFNRNGVLQQLLLGYVRVRLTELSQRAVCNGRHTLKERLSTWLLMIDDRLTDHKILLTQEQIAQNLGAKRASISDLCNEIRDEGIIAYRRGMIRLVSRARLEAVACECYRTLQQFLT
jgi:CRP-like cAMP-binding protein